MNIGVSQIISPVKFLVLIQPENEERFKRAVELTFMLWGGIYSPILPLYEQLPEDYRKEHQIDIETLDFYKNNLENFDPDIILYDEDLNLEYIYSFAGDLEIVKIDRYLVDLKEQHYNHAISTLEVAEYLLETEFKFLRGDSLKFSIHKIVEPDLLLMVFMGTISDDYRAEIEAIFQSNPAFEQPDLEWNTIEAYRSYPTTGLLELNNYRLKKRLERPHYRGSAIYLMQSNRLRDVMNFWNLRAAGWDIIPIPVNMAAIPYFSNLTKKFIDHIATRPNHTHISVNFLCGFGLPEQSLNEAKGAIMPDLTGYKKQVSTNYQEWFPRFWSNYEVITSDHIKGATILYDDSYCHIDTPEEQLSFIPKKLPFESRRQYSRESAYKIILNLSIYDEYAEYAELLNGVNNQQLKRLTQPFDFRKWRLSKAGMHRMLTRNEDEIRLNIPKSLEFFKAYFSNKAHKLVETPNSKLAKEVLKNMEGIRGSQKFLTSPALKVIELFEGGKPIAYNGVVSEIKKALPGKATNTQARNFIASLLEYKIIELGMVIQCTICEQHVFFLPDQLRENIICTICRNQFALPQSDPSQMVWSYRGIGPFSRTNKADGVMAVFATLALFHEEFSSVHGKMSALIGFELVKKNETPKEVDLGLLIQNPYNSGQEPDLLFCECKTYRRFEQKDMDRMTILGDAFPGSILTLATLNDALDEHEVDLIIGLVRHFQKGCLDRPKNSILILTANELLPKGYAEGLDKYKANTNSAQQYADFIGAVSELSISWNLNIPNWWEIKRLTWVEKIQKENLIGGIIFSLLNKPIEVSGP